jgi:alpha-tubulin suppressor-like RCC1 family protein
MRLHRLAALGSIATTVVVLGCGTDSEGPTAPAAPGRAASVAASTLTWRMVSAGGHHSCGVTVDNVAYCWGDGSHGELGNDTSSRGTLLQLTPTPVSGDLHFRIVAASTQFSCGITTLYRAYCWGSNYLNLLGSGKTQRKITHPTPVVGDLAFRQISPGGIHVCGVTTGHEAYCWGDNSRGQLGDGTRTSRPTPVRVAGTQRWRELSTGNAFTCGVTTDDVAYCWGENRQGELGDSSSARFRVRPTAVAGSHRFAQVDAGWSHVCAVTTAGKAYCWGNGSSGALGNGKTYLSFWPRAVSGGHVFTRITAGIYDPVGHTCAWTTAQTLHCWGLNNLGQLGDGTTINRLTPVPVAGGHAFVQAWAGYMYTCGTTPAGEGYCWGSNSDGQLGDGTGGLNRYQVAPVRIAGAD